MQIVAFGYRKGSGKDTCAKFLTTALKLNCAGVKIRKISFAEKLKGICYQLYGWAGLEPGPYYEMHRAEKEIPLPALNGATPRDIWICVGNALRGVYQDTWIQCALREESGHSFGIITDVRFQNEAEIIRGLNGILIRVDRSDIEKGDDPAEVELDGFDDWDYVIDNNEDFNHLNTQLVKIGETLCRNEKEK